MTTPELVDRWRADEQVLAAIGASLFPQDTTCRVRVPSTLAAHAVAAWKRPGDDGTAEEDGPEHEVVRERAAALALLGAQLEPAVAAAAEAGEDDVVEATLDAWYVGVALGAADDLDLLDAAGPVRPSTPHDGPVGFSLWLEFEHVTEPIDDFCNVGITCSDGSAYALNVWTFDFVQALASGAIDDETGALTVGYTPAPDLLVRELTRGQITNAVAHLMANGGLPASCRVPAR